MKTKLKSILAVALCAVGFAAFAELDAVQLWEGGPYWATVNVGAEKPTDYGILTNFNDAAKAVTDALGAGWRLPTTNDFAKLIDETFCTKAWDSTKHGYTFTGATDGYEDKSIFLPAAGYDGGKGRKYAGDEGNYWSSEEEPANIAWFLYFYKGTAFMYYDDRSNGLSVRAVKDPPPPITLGEVKSHEPWDGKFDVEYTLKGLEADVDYKVAFDVKAGGKSTSVTNAAVKLANGTYTNTLNTVDLFGKEVVDTKAKVKVSLIATEKAAGVKLWADGPFFAECNVGADTPEGYGILTNFNDAAAAVTAAMGAEWRVPSDTEWDALLSNCGKGTWTEQNGVKGRRFTGTGNCESNSIFLPAAGVDDGDGRQEAGGLGYYWSSKADGSSARSILFDAGSVGVAGCVRSIGLSVRAVRDAGEGGGGSEEVVATAEKEFRLGPSVFGQDLRRLKAYLHEIWYDYYEDSDLTGDDAPFGDLPVPSLGGCSSVRVGNFHGRNLDLGISDLASIVVHVKADEGRFASVGTTQWGDVSETALTTNGVSVHRFDVLPSWMLDGINENGVAININVIPTDVPQDGENPGSDPRPALHARKVVRYVLDHAESATGVIEDLKKFRIHGNIGTGTYYLHWMISDAEKTFVVEIINGEVVAREHPIMTNFNLNWDNKKQSKITDPENWGPDKYFNPAIYSDNTSKILEVYTPHGDGVERYLTLRDAPYTTMGATFEGMFELMRLARYSRVADLPLDQTFRSDLAEIAEVKSAGLDDIAKVYAAENFGYLQEVWQTLQPKMKDAYAHLPDHRKPGEMGEYSITSHNVTFDLAKKMFRIVVQEEYNEPFDFYLAQPKVEVIGLSIAPQPGGSPLAYIGFKVTSDVGKTNLVFDVAVYSKDRVPYFTDGDISVDMGASFTQDVLKWYGTAGTTQAVTLVWNWKRHNPDLVDWDGVTVEVTAKLQGEDVAVKCKNGTFVGVRDSASGVVAFKSVPYAKPPTKETGLRWKPPVRPDDSEAVVSARHFGPAAAQTRTGGEIASYGPVSEDCLKLSVWTSNGFTAESKRPVMFFIHGGSYASGGMCDPLYDGDRLVWANPDVILVSCDYRVNAFGFLDLTGLPGYDPEKHKDYDQSVNLGILDLQAGLKWVKENIANFGGDPENVTIFGESAGGGSVSCLLQAKGSEGLFQRAIAMSGALDLTDSPENYAVGNQARLLMKAAGKSSVDELLACSTDELIAALNTKLDDSRLATVRHRTPREGGDKVADLNNYPMCDDVRGIVASDAFEAFKTNAVARNVDVMIGTTSEEMNYWATLMYGMPEKEKDPLGYYYHYLSNKVDSVRALYARFDRASVITQFLAGPGASHPFDNDERYNLGGKYPYIWGRTELLSELAFRMPAIVMAERHVAQVGAASGAGKTYMYYFCRPWKSIEMPWQGACHASELTSVFKNLHLDVDGDVKKTLAKNVSGAFVAFAKRGNPGANWAEYETTDRQTTVIGKKGDFEDAELRLESDPDGDQRDLLEPDYLKYREARLRAVDTPVPVALPAGVQGYLYVVSNLTDGVEIVLTETTAGGATYGLPFGAKVAIYAVPTAGYAITGTNPYVIEKVTMETTIDANDLPKAVEVVDADTVVYGTIRTAEKGNPVAGAIAIKDGKYVYVGNADGAAAFVKEGVTKVITHDKGMVMPGCTDGHSHYSAEFGLANIKCGVLFGTNDVTQTVLQKLKAATQVAKDTGKTCLLGFGWDYSKLRMEGGLTLNELDDATPEVSAVLLDSTGHYAYCNSECLKRCGIIDGRGGVLIKEIVGGLLELDENDYPTGYVDERVVGYLMRMGGIVYDELVDNGVARVAIRKTRELLLSTGYTIALDGWSNQLHPSKFYEAASRMDKGDELTLVFPMTYEVEPWQTDADMDKEIAYLASLNETYGTSHVLPEYLKVFMDGIVEAKTGATLKPYRPDEQHPAGFSYKSFWDTNRLAGITRECNAKGLTMHVHTMGDAAVRDTVSAYIQGGDGTHRNCLVHLRNVSTNKVNDFERMAQNNIACTAGFTWHIANKNDEVMEGYLDKDYIYHAYPMKSFFDAGVKVSSHTDYPANGVSPQDPFGIMEIAVTGLLPNPPDGTKPHDTNELITVEQAFQALTINGAWQLGLENERGSIAVGKWADFVLADQDVFTCETNKIHETKVVSTWFEGKLAYPLEPGSKKNPWNIGDCVEAFTNGTELVIQGSGKIADLSEIPDEIKGGLKKLTVTEATVAGAEANAFAGINGVTLTLPDGWQGELPDGEGNWYGATGVKLTGGYPLAVRDVTFQQRYPWNGLVDIGFDLTGAGAVTLKVTALTNGVTCVANPTLVEGETTIDLGVTGGATNGVRLVWDAAADLPAGFKQSGVAVKVTAEK